MKIEQFTLKSEFYVNKLQDLINTMPYKGDKCSNSQKMCLQSTLNEFEYTINGLTEKDFKEEDEYRG